MIETNIQDKKESFLKKEFFMLSWGAAVQHNGVWKNNPTQKTKDVFREKIKVFLEEKLMNTYLTQEEKTDKCPVTEDQHIAIIEELQSESKKHGKDLLIGDCLNFGICQKLLNMMCKYYWCAGYIKEPPHLPIDSINLKNAGIKGKDMVNWTEIEEPQVYINLINKIKEKTSGQSLAQWEVDNWNRRNYKSVSYEK